MDIKQKRNKKTIKIILAILLVVYIGFVFNSTLFGREASENLTYNLELFWSYKVVIETGSAKMLKQIIGNYLMLIPLGFILPYLLEDKVGMKKAMVITIVVGIVTTCCIEVLQLVLKRGLFEWDDIVGNMTGTVVGCVGYRVVRSIIGRNVQTCN